MQLEALQLAGLGAGKRVDELDRARVLVGGDRLLDEVLQLLDQLRNFLVAGVQHDEGLDVLPTLFVGHADDPALRHLRVQ